MYIETNEKCPQIAHPSILFLLQSPSCSQLSTRTTWRAGMAASKSPVLCWPTHKQSNYYSWYCIYALTIWIPYFSKTQHNLKSNERGREYIRLYLVCYSLFSVWWSASHYHICRQQVYNESIQILSEHELSRLYISNLLWKLLVVYTLAWPDPSASKTKIYVLSKTL